MQFWYVRHPFSFYEKRPDIIDLKKFFAEKNALFKSIKVSDKIIYYSHISPKGIVGLFEVKSNGDWKQIKGTGRVWAYEISPLFLANGGHKPVEFVAKKIVGKVDGKYLKPMGAVCKLKPEQYARIKAFLLGMEEPTNHTELETLFSKVHTYLGFQKIKKHQIHYPDAIAIDADGKEKKSSLNLTVVVFLKKDMTRKNVT